MGNVALIDKTIHFSTRQRYINGFDKYLFINWHLTLFSSIVLFFYFLYIFAFVLTWCFIRKPLKCTIKC